MRIEREGKVKNDVGNIINRTQSTMKMLDMSKKFSLRLKVWQLTKWWWLLPRLEIEEAEIWIFEAMAYMSFLNLVFSMSILLLYLNAFLLQNRKERTEKLFCKVNGNIAVHSSILWGWWKGHKRKSQLASFNLCTFFYKKEN